MTVPEPLHPKRSAHASIRGYLYQTCLGVLRWLELKPGEVLVCEGNEDLDCLFGDSNVYEQAKAYTGPIGFTSPVVTENLGNFARDYATLRQKGQQPRFVFTTTAPRKTPRSGPDLLEAWGDVAKRAEVAEAVRGRLASSKLKGLAKAKTWLNAKPERWDAFVGAVEWSFGESFEGIHGDIQRQLAARQETRRLPAEIFADRLAVAVLEASSRKDVQERALTPEDLEKLARTSREELEEWAESAEARRFRSFIDEAKHVGRLLDAKTKQLPDKSPGKLLTADYEVIPFDEEGRREELKLLADWCSQEIRQNVLLLTGEGGSGKTRLLIEWCRRLREQDWHAGFLNSDCREEDLQPLWEGARPRLVAVDYAETRLGIVVPLLAKMGRAAEGYGPKLRLILLARQSSGWWEELPKHSVERNAVEDLIKRSPMPERISPLAIEVTERQRIFEAALEAFSHCLGKPVEEDLTAINLTSADYHRVLYIHMVALLAALDEEASGVQDALRKILDHERTFWNYQALELKLDNSLTDLVRSAMEPVVAGLTLTGGAGDLAQAHTLLDRLLRPFPLRSDLPGAMLHLLHRLYGGSADQGGRYLDPLQPDLLGEQLVDEHLEKDENLLARLLEGARRKEQENTLTVLTRIARDRQDARWLQVALRGNLERLAEVALDVAVTTGDPIGMELSKVVEEQGSMPLVAALADRCDDEKNQASVPLREVAASATARLLALRKEQWSVPTEDQQAELARLASNLGVRLGDLGRHEDALQATQEAVDSYRTLAQQRPDAFLPDLAMSLNNLGNRLSDFGRREDALHTTQEAVDSYRTLTHQRPDAFLPNLAKSLNNLGNRLSGLGRREDALLVTQEAVDSYRTLFQQRPDVFLSDLAKSLNNLGIRFSDLGRRKDALHATQEAVDSYRTLVQQRPDAFLPDLAMSLDSLGNILSDLGRLEDALHATQEAVFIRRQLAQQRPDAFLPDLANSLNNLGIRLSYLGQCEDALHATQEAVSIRRQLAKQRPDAFLSDLAGSHNNLGNILSNLERPENALHATQEAVNSYRTLAQQRPDTFLPDLAMSLNNLGIRLSNLGRSKDALHATQEAVSIRRQLAQQQPDAFLPNLAASLNNSSIILGGLEQQENAFLAIEEAVQILTPFFLRYPKAFEHLMFSIVGQYLTCAQATNREPDPELLRPLQDLLEQPSDPET